MKRGTYFVVIYRGMTEAVGFCCHSPPSEDKRARDEEVDDPVCPPPPTEHRVWIAYECLLDLPIGEGT
jgi:hypothetical protein